MQEYVGTKVIHAEKMTRGDYNKLRGWTIPKDENPNDEGYLVQYDDTYISWSPKYAFDNAYTKSGNFDFGAALKMLKLGFNITRMGWNGKNQFVYCLKGTDLQKGLRYGYGEYENEPTFTNTLVLKNAQNLLVVGWIPSMGDIFAEDWEVVK